MQSLCVRVNLIQRKSCVIARSSVSQNLKEQPFKQHTPVLSMLAGGVFTMSH